MSVLGWAGSLLILMLLFAAPVWPEVGGVKWNGVYQAVCVLILFPLILIAGRHSAGSATTLRLCKAAGRLSYPLYITHYPFVYVYMNWVATGPASASRTALVAVSLYMLTLVFAAAAWRFWDVPIRTRLLARLGRSA